MLKQKEIYMIFINPINFREIKLHNEFKFLIGHNLS